MSHMEGGTNYTCTALSQCWSGSSSSDFSLHTRCLQVKAESGLIHGIDERSGGPYAENLLLQSSSPGHEGVPHFPIEDTACINHTDLYDSCTDGIMLDRTVSSTVTEISRKQHAAVPSQATVRPANMMHGTPKSLFPCGKCDKQYTQPQGVTRHRREAHERKSLCPNCNDFRWSRRYQLTKHLKEQHHHINLDATLCEATRCRREATMHKKHLRRRQASPSFVCGRRSHDKPVARSLMHTLPAVAKDPYVSLPDTRLLDPTTNYPSTSLSTVARTSGSIPADRPSSFDAVPIPTYWPHMLDIMAALSSG